MLVALRALMPLICSSSRDCLHQFSISLLVLARSTDHLVGLLVLPSTTAWVIHNGEMEKGNKSAVVG